LFFDLFFCVLDKNGNKGRDTGALKAFKQSLGKFHFITDGTTAVSPVVVVFVVKVRENERFREKGGKNQICHQNNEYKGFL
jgi:hypothetical protein